MAARRSDLQGAFGLRLPLDVGEIDAFLFFRSGSDALPGGKPVKTPVALQIMDDIEQMARASNVYAFHDRGFGPVFVRDEHMGEPFFLGEERHGEDAPDPFDPSVQGKLPGYQVIRKGLPAR